MKILTHSVRFTLASFCALSVLVLNPRPLSARTLDNFDDNVKTAWQDFAFPIGVPYSAITEAEGQFRFVLQPVGQAIFAASRKTSEEFELRAGRTMEFKVDLVAGGGKDSFAVLAFIPTANSLGTLAGYGLAKSTTDILLTKGINKYFYNENVSPPVKNEKVRLVLRMSATANAVTITGQVLDLEDGERVLWERTVVDTVDADVLADGTDDPAAPYLARGHFSLYCYEDFDRNAPENPYMVTYDNADVCVLDESVLDNFDDNTKTAWDDFRFPIGVPYADIAERNGQFEFALQPVGQAIFAASRKTSQVFDLRECGRLRFSVDLVHGEAKDSFAVLAFIPEANSLGTLAGYGLAKSTTDILLTKGINKYFYNENVNPPVKNDNVTLELSLVVSNSNTVFITGRVLDKDATNAVLWERTVVDTPDADLLADGMDDPAAPYLTRGHFSLYCYEDFDRNAPQAVYQVIYDNAVVLAPTQAANTPPVISDVQPEETANFLAAANRITFNVQDDKPLLNDRITVTLNGTNFGTGNGLSVTGTGNRRSVALGGLTENTDFTAVLRVVDSDGATNSVTLRFDTFRASNIVIEVEDYNFNSGSFIDNPLPGAEGGPQSPDSYTLAAGALGIDYNDTRSSPNGRDTMYRPSDAVRMQHTLDLSRRKFTDLGGSGAMIFDYDVGDIVGGEWMNYTRTFPAGSYLVYLRESLANTLNAECALDEVTGDRTQPEQTTRPLGVFLGRVSGFQYRNVPLTTATGERTILRLSGETTLRLRQVTTPPGDGAISQNYLVLVPTVSVTQRCTVTSVSPAADSTLATVRLNLSATIQNRDTDVNPESIRLSFNGSPVSGSVTSTFVGATISYAVPVLPPSGSLNTARVIFTDNTGFVQTNTWTFTITYKSLNPANRASGSGLERGMCVRMAQGDPNAVPHENSLMQGEDILAGRYPLVMNTNTFSQVVNQTKRPGDTRGVFPDDDLVPGLYDEAQNSFGNGDSDFAVEIVTWLELAPGVYRFGGRTDDGFKCSSGATLHDGSAAATLGFWNGGPADEPARSEFDFVVNVGGLYPFRFMWYERGGAGYAEWYSLDLNSNESLLINGPAANAIKAFKTRANVVLQSAANVAGPYADAGGATVDLANRRVTVPLNGGRQFYRLRSDEALRIERIRVVGGNVELRYRALLQ